ncbi:MAG: hypothetical protein A2X04_12255 [Bacteroidetes bacterium GWF2_41_9]|nr:MAG: hypothetical protein A2X03_07150 [Bacteroidetes bacterium GWA2_40_15]OFX90316.1 MAG: hypothetical protein A2X06_13165 [Bacteroidetes bacterium GWC2_40_22]OFY60041.1 MAG: hypothetical protein A2X04_12255 [Bacteroidetes bacterium GWF2_41_9]HAM11394.1 RloB domain-containing protein [Bacteroidales bacterium]HBH84644.1 RloB domain-containing protein [Bacteroidales bacterium]
MAKTHRQSKGKVIKPTFYVFCEGESEETYVSFLRSRYRVPIQIKTKVASTKISQKYVTNILKKFPRHEKDKNFLLYDLDRSDVVERLALIKGGILLGSNPCIELWFILHTCNHTAEASSRQCVEQLQRICRGYEKGSLCSKLRTELSTGEDEAIKRAKKLKPYSNPSTSVYFLLEELRMILS